MNLNYYSLPKKVRKTIKRYAEKYMREHPLDETLRGCGIDPTALNFLCVTRLNGLRKWVMRTESEVVEESYAFANRTMPDGASNNDWLPSAIEQAREIVLENVDHLSFSMHANESNRLLREAVSFLLECGVSYVDERSNASKLAA